MKKRNIIITSIILIIAFIIVGKFVHLYNENIPVKISNNHSYQTINVHSRNVNNQAMNDFYKNNASQDSLWLQNPKNNSWYHQKISRGLSAQGFNDVKHHKINIHKFRNSDYNLGMHLVPISFVQSINNNREDAKKLAKHFSHKGVFSKMFSNYEAKIINSQSNDMNSIYGYQKWHKKFQNTYNYAEKHPKATKYSSFQIIR